MAFKYVESNQVIVDLVPSTSPKKTPAFVIIVTTRSRRRAYLTLAAAEAACASTWERGEAAHITVCELVPMGDVA